MFIQDLEKIRLLARSYYFTLVILGGYLVSQLSELLGVPQLHLQVLLASVQLVLLPPQAILISSLLSLLQLLVH